MTETTASEARDRLYDRFADRIQANPTLSRRLVSYQGNKRVPGLRWLKYKEGFSADLVAGFLDYTNAQSLLDPFSGAGTAPLTGGGLGIKSTGIEVMPIGNLLAYSIAAASNGIQRSDLLETTRQLNEVLSAQQYNEEFSFPHLPITQMAFPDHTERDLAKVREFLDSIQDSNLRIVLTLACVSVLEEISFTRKDGQFLRWDPQSGRDVKPKLHKQSLPSLSEAVNRRVGEIVEDLEFLKRKYQGIVPNLIAGSCLDELQLLPISSFDTIITSPPYANRYDYTRTYALELAFLGYDVERLKSLRQALLSATVENRSKRKQLVREYGQLATVQQAFAMADEQPALQEVLGLLTQEAHKLSNRNVISLVQNYFTEMALVVLEMGRIVQPGGNVFMVNDNVRYHGQEVPVDLILADFAEQSGFQCEAIWTLTRGKGNSSQQMGRFGRQELRKCVYHWRKVDG